MGLSITCTTFRVATSRSIVYLAWTRGIGQVPSVQWTFGWFAFKNSLERSPTVWWGDCGSACRRVQSTTQSTYPKSDTDVIGMFPDWNLVLPLLDHGFRVRNCKTSVYRQPIACETYDSIGTFVRSKVFMVSLGVYKMNASCRYCLGDEAPLIRAPCKCIGSIGYIHVSCQQKCIPNNKCTICKKRFPRKWCVRNLPSLDDDDVFKMFGTLFFWSLLIIVAWYKKNVT